MPTLIPIGVFGKLIHELEFVLGGNASDQRIPFMVEATEEQAIHCQVDADDDALTRCSVKEGVAVRVLPYVLCWVPVQVAHDKVRASIKMYAELACERLQEPMEQDVGLLHASNGGVIPRHVVGVLPRWVEPGIAVLAGARAPASRTRLVVRAPSLATLRLMQPDALLIHDLQR